MSEDIKSIDFLKLRFIAGILSIVLMVGSVASLFVNGLNLGLDFTGGTLIELGFEQPAQLPKIRAKLSDMGHDGAIVVNYGSEREVLVRLPPSDSASIGQEIADSLDEEGDGTTLRRVEFMGPAMGDELRDEGGLAVITALLMVLIYVSIRFQWKLSLGAVAALFHDVLITLGAFSLFQWEFDLTVLAAFLALIGYSINDTIVVYDRIRENFRKMRKTERIEICNVSLTQTLGRTIMTSGTTLAVVFALQFFGGELIHGFALTLSVGIIIGTYSSIYVASNLALLLGLDRQDLMLPVREDQGDTPTIESL